MHYPAFFAEPNTYLLLEKDPRLYYIYILIHRTGCNLKEKFEGYYFFIII